MDVVLLRVGIDSGSGKTHGPLFPDGSFEFIPIPDEFGVSSKTYGKARARKKIKGKKCPLIRFFPDNLKWKMAWRPIHDDPEFETFTYGDRTTRKGSLRLNKGDLLVFYAGLQRQNERKPKPALYIIGYFEVEKAGLVGTFDKPTLRKYFSNNFHIRHRSKLLLRDKKERDLVLVRGGKGSRLLKKAILFANPSPVRKGTYRLTKKMELILGDLGHITRAWPRKVDEKHTAKAVDFLRRRRWDAVD